MVGMYAIVLKVTLLVTNFVWVCRCMQHSSSHRVESSVHCRRGEFPENRTSHTALSPSSCTYRHTDRSTLHH